MKILKPGKLPDPPKPPWPLDVDFECDHCHCQFVIESDADYSATAERRPNGKFSMVTGCPTCRKQLLFERPVNWQMAEMMR